MPPTWHVQDRDKAEAALIEQGRQHQAAEERTRGLAEARLAEVHREAAGLRAKVDKLEAQGSKVGPREDGGGRRAEAAMGA